MHHSGFLEINILNPNELSIKLCKTLTQRLNNTRHIIALMYSKQLAFIRGKCMKLRRDR